MSLEKETAADLKARLADRRQQRESAEEAAKKKKKVEAKSTAITVGSLSLAAVLGATSLFVASAADSESAAHDEAVLEATDPIADVQQRLNQAEDGEAMLPDGTRANRWIEQAEEAAESVAEVQNTYLDETGPLFVEGVPRYSEDMPVHLAPEERESDEDTAEEWRLSDEERLEIAQQNREQALAGLSRRLSPYFDSDSRASDEFNPVTRWHDHIESIDDVDGEISLANYSWVYDQEYFYDQHGYVKVVWCLVQDETGEQVGMVIGEFNPQSRVIQNLRLVEAVDHAQVEYEGDEEGGGDGSAEEDED